MFLNISTDGDLKRIVVRLYACLLTGAQASRLQMPARFGMRNAVVRLSAWSLIVGLVGQTLIVGPLPRAKANAAQLPAPVSAPPAPFEVSNAGSALSLLPDMNSVIATLVGFAAPKTEESADNKAGFENAVPEPLYEESENGKWNTNNGKIVDSEDSSDCD